MIIIIISSSSSSSSSIIIFQTYQLNESLQYKISCNKQILLLKRALLS